MYHQWMCRWVYYSLILNVVGARVLLWCLMMCKVLLFYFPKSRLRHKNSVEQQQTHTHAHTHNYASFVWDKCIRDKSCLCVSSSNCVGIYLLSAFTDICTNRISDGSGINWQRLASLVGFFFKLVVFAACWKVLFFVFVSPVIVLLCMQTLCTHIHELAPSDTSIPWVLSLFVFGFPICSDAVGWRSGCEHNICAPCLHSWIPSLYQKISHGCLSFPFCT